MSALSLVLKLSAEWDHTVVMHHAVCKQNDLDLQQGAIVCGEALVWTQLQRAHQCYE